jgi:magnesium chelatase subunit D
VALPADPLRRALLVLSCLAAESRLGGVLLLDLDPDLLLPFADWLADHIAVGDGRGIRPPVHVIGPGASDETLWMRPSLSADGLTILPGALVERPSDPPPVIVVPDLCRASVFTARAAISTLGADQASAERLSVSYRWRPRARWLAAADRTEARALSPHLLDRFPVRVAAADIAVPWSADLARLAEQPDDAALRRWLPPLPAPARATAPVLTRAAADRVIALVPPGPSRRRDLAVGRVARAIAARDGAGEITAQHVDDAAVLLGLTPAATAAFPRPPEMPEHDRPAGRKTAAGAVADGTALATAASSPDARVASPGPGTALELATVTLATADAAASRLSDWLYPEDHPDALAPHESLLDAGHGPASARHREGRPVGTQRASDLHDIAIVATVLEAAKFQRFRRRARGGRPARRARGRLVIWPVDLRTHRRLPTPAAALVLVLDHSCWQGWDMDAAIASYLRRAYVENAAVSVVEFGHRDAEPELRATSYRAGSLLDPRVTDSLNRQPGRASPLAHGLDLAVQELRRHLRGTPRNSAVLLVATDARGNVPLASSLLDRMPRSQVAQSGVQDALASAGAVRGMSRVEAVVVTPGVDQYAGLPFDLAEAMDGAVILAARRDDGQGAQP